MVEYEDWMKQWDAIIGLIVMGPMSLLFIILLFVFLFVYLPYGNYASRIVAFMSRNPDVTFAALRGSGPGNEWQDEYKPQGAVMMYTDEYGNIIGMMPS